MQSVLLLRYPVQYTLTGFLCLFWFTAAAQQGPAGFATTPYGQRIYNASIVIVFDGANRMYTCEKVGRVQVSMNGLRADTQLIDISEEVDSYSDRGLLGMALDPNYAQNGYIYLSYAVDRHHLFNFGTPAYDPTASEVGATVLRVARYTVSPASLTTTTADGLTLVPNSRLVLFGETKSTGEPLLDGSHSGGDLAFGADGTLLLSTGDGAGLNGRDQGGAGNPGYGSSFWQQALADGIIDFRQNIGSYRSQYLDSFNGKILRLDPATGDGLPSNPYYDPARPRSARSRVFARGLRNPYRMSIRPGTGSTNPADGNPGSLYIGDVGWNRYEELHIMNRPGQNFGWPYFEGMSFVEGRSEFYPLPANTINNPADSTQNSYFDQLPNPDDSTALFSKPQIAIGHQSQGTSYLEHGVPMVLPDLNLPYNNVSLGANAIIDGGWTNSNPTLPAEYRNKYFFGDYVREWIAYAEFDSEDNPMAINHFAQGFNGLTTLTINPNNNQPYLFYYFNVDIYELAYTGNQPPVVSLETDKTYGPTALTVAFDGSASEDPENTSLAYVWDFGDGSPVSTSVSPVHSYSAVGVQSFTATLTVTDGGGASTRKTVLLSVNNTPPVVQSTSLDNLTLISATADTPLTLSAVVTDAQHNGGQLTYLWQVSELHNDHGHPQTALTTPTGSVTLLPLGNCSGLDSFWYRITLTVTDTAGLSTTTYRDLYPNCGGNQQLISFATPVSRPKTIPPFRPPIWSSSGLPITLYVVSGPAFMEGTNIRLTGSPGMVTLRAVQHGNTTYRPAAAVERSFRVLNNLPTADLSLAMVFDNRVVAVDSLVALSFILTNNGPDPTSNAVLVSRLPTNLTFVGSTSLTYQGGLVSGTVSTLFPGNSETVTMLVRPTAPGTFRPSAEITSAATFDPDSQPNTGTSDGEDDAATADLRTSTASTATFESPNPSPRVLPPVESSQPKPTPNRVDLSLTMQTDKRVAVVGEPVQLSLTVSNTGSLSATNIVVRDTLRGFTMGSSSALSVVISGTGYTVVEGTIASLLPGQSATLTGPLLPTATGTLQTSAQVWSVGLPGPSVPDDADSTPGNGTRNGEDDCALLDWRVR